MVLFLTKRIFIAIHTIFPQDLPSAIQYRQQYSYIDLLLQTHSWQVDMNSLSQVLPAFNVMFTILFGAYYLAMTKDFIICNENITTLSLNRLIKDMLILIFRNFKVMKHSEIERQLVQNHFRPVITQRLIMIPFTNSCN